MCTEDIPRQERASENYSKQARDLDMKIMSLHMKWKESRDNLNLIIEQAVSEEPILKDFVENIKLLSESRRIKAENNLRQKLLHILNEEINAFTDYMSDMPSMLKKLYLTLKGYDKVTPLLTSDYLRIMKQIKSAKTISWSDVESESSEESNFIYSLNIDLENPVPIPESFLPRKGTNMTIHLDNDESADIENRNPIRSSAKKRKGTPIKMDNDTIVIDDSINGDIDTTQTITYSGK